MNKHFQDRLMSEGLTLSGARRFLVLVIILWMNVKIPIDFVYFE